MEATIFDLDGTLADNSHRLHYVRSKQKDWVSFFKAIPNDKPIVPIMDLAKLLIKVDKVVLLTTGRPQRYKNETANWLIEHGVDLDFDKKLFMRKNDDKRPDEIIKQDIMKEIIKLGFIPTLVFEDRQSVVDMWRSHGIRVAQVAHGNF